MRFSFCGSFFCHGDICCCWCYWWLFGWCVCVCVCVCVVCVLYSCSMICNVGKRRKGDKDTLLLHIIHPAWRKIKRCQSLAQSVHVTSLPGTRPTGFFFYFHLSFILYKINTTTRTMSHSHGPDGAAGGLHITNNTSQPQPQGIAQPPPPVVLTPALLESLKVSKIFKDNTQAITSIHFDDTGSKCVTSAADESLHVYDCYTGKYVSLSLVLWKG